MKLEVDSLNKEYRGFASIRERILAALSLGLYMGSVRISAVQGFDLKAGYDDRGEILGIIGFNGAGKSTLLRILAGNSEATSGRIRFNGTIRSILELGVGFSPELTGRENIYYNGRLWGYGSKRLKDATDDILGFARLQEFSQWPLKTYSTGMRMRLGFALATFERSDLLLVDEAMAVGDASFQQKCIRRFQEFRNAGSLILVVSHDIHMLHSLCDRIILLDRGKTITCDNPSKAIEAYMNLIAGQSFGDHDSVKRLSEQAFSIQLLGENGLEKDFFFTGEQSLFRITICPETEIQEVTVGIHISDSRGIRVFGTNTHLLKHKPITFRRNKYVNVDFRLKMNLGPGRYAVGCSVHRGSAHSDTCYLWRESVKDFEVELSGSLAFEGLCHLEPELVIDSN